MLARAAYRSLVLILITAQLCSGCAYTSPYVGKNPQNPQFERGASFPPLDFLGDLLSKPYQLLFWTSRYGNHRVSSETERLLAQYLSDKGLLDVKVRINQWAPLQEVGRVFRNRHIAWPYKILFLPSTLIASILGRPFSGFLISDYYDPASNTINIFSDEIAIALHEGGHAKDFASRRWKGTYALTRLLPGINVFQEATASDEAFYYLESIENYDELFRAYRILYPAYSTYVVNYISSSPFALLGTLTFGHIVGRTEAYEKRWQLEDEGKIQASKIV